MKQFPLSLLVIKKIQFFVIYVNYGFHIKCNNLN